MNTFILFNFIALLLSNITHIIASNINETSLKSTTSEKKPYEWEKYDWQKDLYDLFQHMKSVEKEINEANGLFFKKIEENDLFLEEIDEEINEKIDKKNEEIDKEIINKYWRIYGKKIYNLSLHLCVKIKNQKTFKIKEYYQQKLLNYFSLMQKTLIHVLDIKIPRENSNKIATYFYEYFSNFLINNRKYITFKMPENLKTIKRPKIIRDLKIIKAVQNYKILYSEMIISGPTNILDEISGLIEESEEL